MIAVQHQISDSQSVIMQQRQMNTNVAFQPSQSQYSSQPGYVVVNETPSGPAQRLTFPINFRENAVLRISIAKIVIGFIQVVVGIADIFFLPFFTSIIAFPIWCGLLFIVNGIIGIVTKCKQSKCMIASFLGLSIVSLFCSSVMLVCYVIALAYYASASDAVTCLRYGYYGCEVTVKLYKTSYVSVSIGLAVFLVVLIVSELAYSIAAVIVSCRAYSKCCNTCLFSDCGTCVGCCECSMATTATAPYQDLGAEPSRQYPLHQYQEQEATQTNPWLRQYPEQRGAGHRFQQEPNQTNPCSALFNIIINIGGAPSQTACIQRAPTDPNSIEVNINNAEPAAQRNDAILQTHDRQIPQNQTGGHVDSTGQLVANQAPVASYQVIPNEQNLLPMEKGPYGP